MLESELEWGHWQGAFGDSQSDETACFTSLDANDELYANGEFLVAFKRWDRA